MTAGGRSTQVEQKVGLSRNLSTSATDKRGPRYQVAGFLTDWKGFRRDLSPAIPRGRRIEDRRRRFCLEATSDRRSG
jgi:hypothetical protein